MKPSEYIKKYIGTHKGAHYPTQTAFSQAGGWSTARVNNWALDKAMPLPSQWKKLEEVTRGKVKVLDMV